ncbi:transposase, partial [Burkholderia ubonensis]|uniref:transposase n=1 Tax=Burkholderia ubonensis TaxID=101571 RepID=UPI001E598E3B
MKALDPTGQGVTVVARELGVSEQTLRNWAKAEQEGKVGGTGAKLVGPEQMELSRLRAEVAKNLSAFLWVRRLNKSLATRLRESLTE